MHSVIILQEMQESFKVGRAVVSLRRERETSASSAQGTSGSSGPSSSSGANGNSTSAAVSAPPEKPEAEKETDKKSSGEIMHLAGKPCPTGTYQLLSVVTHQGRYADSGHYVGWAKAGGAEGPQGPPGQKVEEQKDDRNEPQPPTGPAAKRQKNVVMWRKFDDDKVSEIPWEGVDLSGGRSDYHVAYLLLMKHIIVTPSQEELRAVESQL